MICAERGKGRGGHLGINARNVLNSLAAPVTSVQEYPC